MQYPNPTEPDFGESPKAAKRDYVLGGLWTIYGVFMLLWMHLVGRLRTMRGH